MDFVCAAAPATVANVGPGFDCFGFSLGEPCDEVWARESTEPGVHISEIRGDGGELSTEAAQNTAGRAAQAVLEGLATREQPSGLELVVVKGLPLCSGLGSSAASAVAGAEAAMHVAVNCCGAEYDAELVLHAALEGEAVAAGARHADNVVPAMVGGFTVVVAHDPPSFTRLEPRLALHAVVAHPELRVATRDARAILPLTVPLHEACAQAARAAGTIAALLTGDAGLLRQTLIDRLVEPHRAGLIKGFAKVQRAALNAGALGCSISGAGPAVFALCTHELEAAACKAAMREAFAAVGVRCDFFVGPISPRGVHLR